MGVSPSYGMIELFENSCMKTAFSCTLNDIITGIVYVVAYTNTLPPPPFFFFYSNQRRGGGGGGMDACAP